MEATTHHRTWDNEPHLVGVIRKNSYEGSTSEMKRQGIVTEVIRQPSNAFKQIWGVTLEEEIQRIEVRGAWRPSNRSSTSNPPPGKCRMEFGLVIHQNDHQARRRFVEWAQNEIVVVPDFHKRILFNDFVNFWLNGYVNKQNCRIWSEANPQVYVETPLYPEKLIVWCALWTGGILLQKTIKATSLQSMVIGIEP
ncbi:DUF4817 domain-containing protein [Trichonephila clavipes]|uniref:DUF4817 domain-containing protein n=1 Tax=Trichonephila clavipes TaxID=2585209 RepID=A0A8X7BAU2_TRICX|nr:DUF4817 domain-containing protein [Trichonephila clavipes]